MSDIDTLTIGEAREAVQRCKEIEKIIGGNVAIAPASAQTPDPFGLLGKYVIVRCAGAGVHAGVLAHYDGRACVLTDSRRLWRWRVPKGKSDFLSGVALYGIADDCKIAEAVPRIALTENCELIECSAEAEKSIREFVTCTRTI